LFSLGGTWQRQRCCTENFPSFNICEPRQDKSGFGLGSRWTIVPLRRRICRVMAQSRDNTFFTHAISAWSQLFICSHKNKFNFLSAACFCRSSSPSSSYKFNFHQQINKDSGLNYAVLLFVSCLFCCCCSLHEDFN
jgi:hypothetical protein